MIQRNVLRFVGVNDEKRQRVPFDEFVQRNALRTVASAVVATTVSAFCSIAAAAADASHGAESEADGEKMRLTFAARDAI